MVRVGFKERTTGYSERHPGEAQEAGYLTRGESMYVCRIPLRCVNSDASGTLTSPAQNIRVSNAPRVPPAHRSPCTRHLIFLRITEPQIAVASK